MTSQTPAPNASSTSTLLASLSNAPSVPQPAQKGDFLSAILQALTRPKSADASSPSAGASQPAQEKSAPAPAETPDAIAASALLAWLIPALPNLPKPMAQKPSGSPARSASAVSSDDAKLGVGHGGAAARFSKDNGATLLSSLRNGHAPPPLKDHENKVAPLSGTSAANTKTGMSLNTERDEIAARKEQKLPVAPVSATASADTGSSSPDSGAKTPLPLAFSWHETPSEQLAIIDFSAKATRPAALDAVDVAEAPASAVSSTPMDRLEQMISRESMTIKNIGGQTLGVSLKLDSGTQLFLQLTNNNGSVQASLSLERGQFTADDSQWAQLQQSLARQNIDLAPMNGSAGEHSRQPASQQDRHTASNAVQPANQRNQQSKQQNRSRKNWESWA
ncbi:MAG TPA: hypothetical protein VGO59_15140 [Verrucomicrobiae bacterium]|jgi:hypothetical protein